VNAVYLQAFTDPDGDGAADAVYFPSRRVPMRADLFSRVAWQIRTRTPVRRLYAWMPMLAWVLPPGDVAAKDVVVALPSEKSEHLNMGYKRLSPFSAAARTAIRELYTELARAAPIDGLLFHDDVTLSDYEDDSSYARQAYRDWGLPASVADIRRSDDLVGRWTILKINALDDFASELAALVREQQPALRVARNLYARVVQSPRAEVWYSQALENSLRNYDFTAIMAMPYMEGAADHKAFYRELVDKVKARPGGLRKTVFELQTVDWRKDSAPLPIAELTDTIEMLYGLGVEHIAYYPDLPFQNHPAPAALRKVLALKADRASAE
jgi:biofilm PGA synthesis lipoprotein PgaB